MNSFILCVCINFFDIILLRFRLFEKLLFRFVFHTAKSYGSYGSGSGSTTLDSGLPPRDKHTMRQATQHGCLPS
jgi:hypothetical protein